jgi:hypothetical protein
VVHSIPYLVCQDRFLREIFETVNEGTADESSVSGLHSMYCWGRKYYWYLVCTLVHSIPYLNVPFTFTMT